MLLGIEYIAQVDSYDPQINIAPLTQHFKDTVKTNYVAWRCVVDAEAEDFSSVLRGAFRGDMLVLERSSSLFAGLNGRLEDLISIFPMLNKQVCRQYLVNIGGTLCVTYIVLDCKWQPIR